VQQTDARLCHGESQTAVAVATAQEDLYLIATPCQNKEILAFAFLRRLRAFLTSLPVGDKAAISSRHFICLLAF